MAKTMSLSINVMVLIVMTAASSALFMLHGAEAAEYTVGDELGWTIPPGGAATYAAWASKHHFIINDILNFNFKYGESDLAVVTKENYDSCNTTDPLIVFKSPGPYVLFFKEGTYYVTCTFAGHCSKGQKIALYFASPATGSPTPIPTPSQSQSQSDAATDEQSATTVKFLSKKEYGFKN